VCSCAHPLSDVRQEPDGMIGWCDTCQQDCAIPTEHDE